jgi:multidrug efflux pump subunit AcrB
VKYTSLKYYKGDIMKSCKLSWTLVVVLLIIVAIFAYKFTKGEVQPSEDGRQAVMLSKDERNALLLEMRTWLQSSQGILAAAAANDFDTVIKSAKASGMGAEAGTPGSLFRKLPVEMKALGFDTRSKFDAIAADAEKLKDSKHTITQLLILYKVFMIKRLLA